MIFKIVYQISFLDDGTPVSDGGVINHKITANELESVKRSICAFIDNNFKIVQDGPLLEQAELAIRVPAESYTDQTRMGFGKHKGKLLQDVPASYLHWLWTQRPLADKQLEAYINSNLSSLRTEHPDGIWT